jgi:WD40 repeat protein
LNNGKVLLAGALNSTAELYGPSTGIFSSTGSIPFQADNPVATLLPNGKVLLASGSNAAVYDPTAGVFSLTSSMTDATRDVGSLTLLQNGKVLVLGGDATAELYDPTTGSFSFTGSMATARSYGFTATLLTNGEVLVAGGEDPSSNMLSSAELFDPATGIFSPTGSMTVAKEGAVSILLGNNKVLVVGGDWTYTGGPAEIYDPSSGTFTETSTPPVYPHYGILAGTLLPNGLIFIGGGILSNGTPSAPWSNRTEFYDPANGTFYAGPPLNDASGNTIGFSQNAMTILPNGTVLIAGFFGASDHNTDIYTPGTTNPLPATASRSENSVVNQFQSSGMLSRLPTIKAP